MTQTICWRVIIHTEMILTCHLSTRRPSTTSLLISTFTIIPTSLSIPSPHACSILCPSAIFYALSPLHSVSCTQCRLLPSSAPSSFPLLPTPFPLSSPRADFPTGLRIMVAIGGWTPAPVLVHFSPLPRVVPRRGCSGRDIPISIQSCSHHNNSKMLVYIGDNDRSNVGVSNTVYVCAHEALRVLANMHDKPSLDGRRPLVGGCVRLKCIDKVTCEPLTEQ